jgi:hypothetical protein
MSDGKDQIFSGRKYDLPCYTLDQQPGDIPIAHLTSAAAGRFFVPLGGVYSRVRAIAWGFLHHGRDMRAKAAGTLVPQS